MNTSFERPYKPVDLNTSLTRGLPLPSLAEKLMTEAVVFTGDVLHSVYANEDSVFLIVIGGAAAKNSKENE